MKIPSSQDLKRNAWHEGKVLGVQDLRERVTKGEDVQAQLQEAFDKIRVTPERLQTWKASHPYFSQNNINPETGEDVYLSEVFGRTVKVTDSDYFDMALTWARKTKEMRDERIESEQLAYSGLERKKKSKEEKDETRD